MMNWTELPAFADNCIGMLHHGARAWVVDPGDAAAVQAALDARGLELAAILVTHAPADPVDGMVAPCGRFESIAEPRHPWLAPRAAAEPGKRDIGAPAACSKAERGPPRVTRPSTIDHEWRIPAFLHREPPAVVAKAQERGATSEDPVAVFAAWCEWKNELQ